MNSNNMPLTPLVRPPQEVFNLEVQPEVEEVNLHDNEPKIPDGGWGWFVLLAVFMMNGISDIIMLILSYLSVEFMDEFQIAHSAAFRILYLFASISHLSGPIASAFVDRYGCRLMTIIGALICVVGFVASSYARSIGVMCVTLGVIPALGRSIFYITGVVSLTFWFEKKRAFIFGLALWLTRGTGIGIETIFIPFFQWSLDNFGWRGAIFIFAGIIANICVCGMLMRNPDWIIQQKRRQRKEKKRNENSFNMKVLKNTVLNDPPQNRKQPNTTNSYKRAGDKTRRIMTQVSLPTYLKESEKVWYKECMQLNFFLLALSTIILSIWGTVPSFYLAEHMRWIYYGYSDYRKSFILSAIGIGNIVGLIILGCIGNRLNVAKTYAVCLIISGLSIGAMILFSHYFILLMISCSVFGLSFISCFTLMPTLLIELVSLEGFTMAYGLVSFCEGIGNLIGPPLIGYLYDTMREPLNHIFYQAAYGLISSGILVGLITIRK